LAVPPPLIALRGASARIGSQVLFADLDVAIERGQRVALVGRNGSGKSTLLRALVGLQELDSGTRFLQPRTTVALLAQDPALMGATILDAVLSGLPADHDPEVDRHLAHEILARLAMPPDRPTATLSGGETKRVALAHVLVGRPDVLLLDEPTNHLDLAGIEWLEGELERFAGALVLVSHDRSFLTALARTVWWLDRGRLRTLDDGFAAFPEWSAAVLDAEAAELARLDDRLAAETQWLHKGVTARRRRNMGRLRRLEQLRAERRAWLAPTGTAQMRAEPARLSGRLVIEAENVGKSFGGRPIVAGFSIRILRGDRVGVIGPNGCGKTTLLRLLTGELAPDHGRVRLGTALTIARFDQHRDQLDLERTPWETLCPTGGDRVVVRGRSQHVVGYLRDFLFREEQARQPVRALSGGERNRLLLARILLEPANLLVLDEPTNDLDVETLELLEELLADWPGTLLLVSHDRAFLDRLVTSTVAFEGSGRFREYPGGYSDWLRQCRPPAGAPRPVAPSRPARTEPRPAAFRTPRPRRELERLETHMEELRARIVALETELADPTLYERDPARLTAAGESLGAAREALAELEDRWLAIAAELEQR
jgi:ATP-binding cassette subfamily F protein uup